MKKKMSRKKDMERKKMMRKPEKKNFDPTTDFSMHQTSRSFN